MFGSKDKHHLKIHKPRIWGLPCICGSLWCTAYLYIYGSRESCLWLRFYRYASIEISTVPQNNTYTWETVHRHYCFITVLFYHKLAAQSLPLLLIWSDRVNRAVHKPFRYSDMSHKCAWKNVPHSVPCTCTCQPWDESKPEGCQYLYVQLFAQPLWPIVLLS